MTTASHDAPRAQDGSSRTARRLAQIAAVERVALDLFAKHGFAAVTADQIAEAAGVSRRTFFRYFPSKEDVLLGDRQRYEETLARALELSAPDVPPIEALRRCLIAMSEEVEADREANQLRVRLFQQSPQTLAAAAEQQRTYLMRLTPVLARRMGLDETRDMRPLLIVNAIMSTTSITLLHWLASGAARPLHELVAEALDYAAAGFPDMRRHTPTGD